jgi:hypothetical protein
MYQSSFHVGLVSTVFTFPTTSAQPGSSLAALAHGPNEEMPPVSDTLQRNPRKRSTEADRRGLGAEKGGRVVTVLTNGEDDEKTRPG